MKKSKFTEAQIVFAIRHAESGVKIQEVCRNLGSARLHFTTGKINMVDWALQNLKN